MHHSGRTLAAAIATAALFVCPRALAGGFNELPDLGGQALGRGATFVAKADDATALYYNVAGIARQRGTSLQISGNLQVDNFTFARAGRYPDSPTDPATPWGGKPFPVAEDKNASFLLPMMVGTTDLGMFDRLTFGFGVWSPPAAGRTFPLGINGQPSPARYDYVQQSGLVAFPTLGAGYRLTDKIDIGVAAHLVIVNLQQLQIAYTDPGGGACKNPEYILCDTKGALDAKGTGFAASAGILARPTSSFQVGAQVKTAWKVQVDGTASAQLGSGTPLPTEPAGVSVQFPWIVSAGARHIGLRQAAAEKGSTEPPKPFEAYDLELDATYEAWSAAGNPGPVASTIDPTTNKPTSVPLVHNYNDTFSVRAGGAYNIDLDGAVFSLRAGAFYESPTTDNAYTRIDVDTMAKVAGTVGLGYKRGAFALNLAYAGIESIGRDVTDGDIRPPNSAKDGQFVDGDGKQLPAVNNGSYRAFTHVLSFAIQVNFETLFGKPRKSTFGDPEYEDVAPPPAPRPPPEVASLSPSPSPSAPPETAPPPPEPPPTESAPAASEPVASATPPAAKKRSGKSGRGKTLRRTDAR